MTPEQQARDLLERMEVPGAQNYTAGEVGELANLIHENTRLRGDVDRLYRERDRILTEVNLTNVRLNEENAWLQENTKQWGIDYGFLLKERDDARRQLADMEQENARLRKEHAAAIEQAEQAEREACARAVETATITMQTSPELRASIMFVRDILRSVAAAIRQRAGGIE